MSYRIESKGKGILQHHQIVAEFEAIPEDNRKTLAGGAFAEVLRSTQVTLISLAFLSFSCSAEFSPDCFFG